jgi:phosphohistidine phosphatase SixA
LIAAADTVWNRMRGDVLLRELRVGTLVLACRHAITDRSHGDNRNVDFEDRTTQRNLSAEGERQARDLGREIEELNLPIGTVLTSPYARTRESAELTFGRAENSTLLYGQRSRNEVQALFGEAPTNGNRVLMTHQYVLRRMLRVFRNGEIAEGDCVVVHPLGGEGYEIVAHLKPEDWGSLRSSDARSRRGAGRLNHISAVYR